MLEVENGASVTYTVPGKIRLANVDKAVEVFFRVNRVCGNSVIRVTAGSGQHWRHTSASIWPPARWSCISVPRALAGKGGRLHHRQRGGGMRNGEYHLYRVPQGLPPDGGLKTRWL